MQEILEKSNRLLSEEEKWAVVTLKKYANYSNSAIERALGIGSGTICKILQKYESFGTVANRYKSGQKKIQN